MTDLKIQKGEILIYRIYDVASEILLSRLQPDQSARPTVDKPLAPKFISRPTVINLPHMEFNFGQRPLKLGQRDFTCDVDIKVRDFGVISVILRIEIPPGISWRELVSIAASLDKGTEPDELSLSLRSEAINRIRHAMIEPSNSRLSEEYIIYGIQEFSGADSIDELLERVDVPALLWAEPDFVLSASSAEAARENLFQYAENDLAIVEWNSALVIDPSGSHDIPDVLEFALSHLLETRYYDDLLDNRLRDLYDQIHRARGTLLGGSFDRIYRESSIRFIEFAAFTERIENAFKVVGDFFLAKIYRTATREFRIQDWQANVTRKIGILGQVSNLLQGEVNYRRSHLLELVIILLILYEVLAAVAR